MSDAESDPDVILISSKRPHPPTPPRRSTRSRRKPSTFTPNIDTTLTSDPQIDHRLEQIPFSTPLQLGLHTAPGRISIRITPVAMALINFHAHLTRTEVIGYLGGIVRTVADVRELIIVEAFPAKPLNERALAREGRSAYTEVEVDPESSVEVIGRVTSKNLSVVGWYHSHPDATFTVEPSRVDIENQQNYQQMLFREKPFVAAIIAPYNQDLPDHHPDIEFFNVHHNDIPVKLPYQVGKSNIPEDVPNLDQFAGECHQLIEIYCSFGKRVRLEKDWRPGVTGVEKLRRLLTALEEAAGYKDVVDNVLLALQTAWNDSAQRDEERRLRNRRAGRKKRLRRN